MLWICDALLVYNIHLENDVPVHITYSSTYKLAYEPPTMRNPEACSPAATQRDSDIFRD